MRGWSLLVVGCIACGSAPPEGGAAPADTTAGAEGGGAGLSMRDPDDGPRGELGMHTIDTREVETAADDGSVELEERPDDEGDLPLVPSPADRERVLDGLTPELRRCVQGQASRFRARIVIESSGLVREALVEGPLRGTPEGDCVEGALRAARFPRFRDPQTSVTHRFRL